MSSELILGGQRSGKSRQAELLAGQWLETAGTEAIYIASARACDQEMQDRISRHQADRAKRLPRMATIEEPIQIAAKIKQHSTPRTLIVIDCLTLWLTNLLMPTAIDKALSSDELAIATEALVKVINEALGPIVLVSNEIGLGVIPMGPDVRKFVDAQGRLNQQMAAACTRVTLMTAGLPLKLKG